MLYSLLKAFHKAQSGLAPERSEWNSIPVCHCLRARAGQLYAKTEPILASVQVPYRLLKAFHKVQQRLVRELEKKFSGKDVVLIANRRIMPTPSSGKSIARPRSRTLTAVRSCGCGCCCSAMPTASCVPHQHGLVHEPEAANSWHSTLESSNSMVCRVLGETSLSA